LNHLRTELHRYRSTNQSSLFNAASEKELHQTMARLLSTMVDYDNQIAPMLYQEGSHFNPYWGYLSRAGFNDKSHFMRQIEKYADVYTSRVSNFLRYTPYMYFRSYTHILAHNRNLDKYRAEVPKSVLENIDRYPVEEDGGLDASAVLLTYQGTPALKPSYSEADEDEKSEDGQGIGVPNAQPNLELVSAAEFGHVTHESGIASLDDMPNARPISQPEVDDFEEFEDDLDFGSASDSVQPR